MLLPGRLGASQSMAISTRARSLGVLASDMIFALFLPRVVAEML